MFLSASLEAGKAPRCPGFYCTIMRLTGTIRIRRISENFILEYGAKTHFCVGITTTSKSS